MAIETTIQHLNGHSPNGVDKVYTNGKNGSRPIPPAEATENPYAIPPEESYDPAFESLVEQMLRRLGEDPTRDGLKRTPLRVAKAMDFLTSGYSQSLAEVVNGALFEAEGQEMGAQCEKYGCEDS